MPIDKCTYNNWINHYFDTKTDYKPLIVVLYCSLVTKILVFSVRSQLYCKNSNEAVQHLQVTLNLLF